MHAVEPVVGQCLAEFVRKKILVKRAVFEMLEDVQGAVSTRCDVTDLRMFVHGPLAVKGIVEHHAHDAEIRLNALGVERGYKIAKVVTGPALTLPFAVREIGVVGAVVRRKRAVLRHAVVLVDDIRMEQEKRHRVGLVAPLFHKSQGALVWIVFFKAGKRNPDPHFPAWVLRLEYFRWSPGRILPFGGITPLPGGRGSLHGAQCASRQSHRFSSVHVLLPNLWFLSYP